MKKLKKVIYLESRQNLVWTSMQEIFPSIKETWIRFCEEEKCELLFINVDEVTPKTVLKDIMISDLMVVSCFNGNVARFLEIIRVHLKLDIPWAFYLHGLASVGLWPVAALGLKDCLQGNDFFLGTCEGDQKALSLGLPLAKYVPTTFFSKTQSDLGPIQEGLIRRLVYIGRISRQKNLHQLLWALSLLKKQEATFKELHLDIYGAEDDLDGPNMGLRRKGYLQELYQIRESLNLGERDVTFHGFKERSLVEAALQEDQFLFTSMSLHSDENFGMAALMALQSGCPLLLSDWGGHCNFRRHHSDRVGTVPVYQSHNGPCIKINDIVLLLSQYLKGVRAKTNKCFFSLENALNSLRDLKRQLVNSQETQRITFSPLVLKLLEKRVASSDPILSQKVFDSYFDTNAHEFFKAYGACLLKDNHENFSSYELAPWAREEQGNIIVNDPHRGHWQGSLSQAYLLGYIFIE